MKRIQKISITKFLEESNGVSHAVIKKINNLLS